MSAPSASGTAGAQAAQATQAAQAHAEFPDWSAFSPARLWRDWIVKSEAQWSETVSQLLKDERTGDALNRQISEMQLMHRQFAELAQASLAAANLPSRSDFEALDERMGRLEDGLAQLAAAVSQLGQAIAAALPRLANPVQRTLERMGLPAADFAHLTGVLGSTPKDTIHAQGTLKLHHYRPLCDSVYRVPVLIVTSLVNQPYILDLVPGQSMVEFLLRQGFDVYMIEWGRPRREHSGLTLEDHVLDRLPACVEQVLRHSGQRELSIIGYCIGGLLSVLWAALPHTRHDALKNLVCMATPVNSDGLESLKAWMGEDFDEEALLAAHGNVPAEWVQNALRALRPFGKVSGAMNLLNHADNEDVVRSNLRMGKWETDNIPFPGGVFRQMVRDFLRGNHLMDNAWRIGGHTARLSHIRAPLLHLLAQDDHITPYASSRDLVQRVDSADRQELILKGGHVGLVAGRGAELRMWPALEAWLAPRSV